MNLPRHDTQDEQAEGFERPHSRPLDCRQEPLVYSYSMKKSGSFKARVLLEGRPGQTQTCKGNQSREDNVLSHLRHCVGQPTT